MKHFSKPLLLTLVTIVFLISVFFLTHIVPVVENIFYDLSFAFTKVEPSDEVVIVGIDPESTGEIGNWPWRCRTRRQRNWCI